LEKDPPKLTGLEQNIFNLIKKDSTITRNDIADKLNLSSETIKEYLEKLKEKEFIIRVGGRKKDIGKY
jgi:DeoR/GlpR family transcriptional regulator of sugar metabolism